VGSQPAVALTVQAVASVATGRVKSIPKGIDIKGGDSSTALFTQTDVTLSAEPDGPRARAVFSGDCAATGAYGKAVDCTLSLAGGNTVTVTYECKPGFSCDH
jgi:hypothetical protein